MRSIGLIIGNLAFDGISARDLLTKALLESNFIESVVTGLTESKNLDAIECALWALDNLLNDSSNKSYRALSKQVYNDVVKQLNLI